jgi:hypothetical protein
MFYPSPTYFEIVSLEGPTYDGTYLASFADYTILCDDIANIISFAIFSNVATWDSLYERGEVIVVQEFPRPWAGYGPHAKLTDGKLSHETVVRFGEAELVSWLKSPGYGAENFCKQIEVLGDFIHNAISS